MSIPAFLSGVLASVWMLTFGLIANAFTTKLSDFWTPGISSSHYWPYPIITIIFYAALFLISAVLLRRFHFSPLRFAIIIILLATLARLIWVVFFDSYQVSDFAWYYYCGLEIAHGGGEACMDPIIWKRSVVYTAPIAFFFGNSLIAVELINIALFVFSATFFFLLGKRLYGVHAAALGLLAFVIWPDYWYVITLASHDNGGITWLAAFLYVLTVLHSRVQDKQVGILTFCLAVVMGLLLTILSYARSYGLFAVGACTITAVVYLIKPATNSALRKKPIGATLILVLPLVIHISTNLIIGSLANIPTVSENKRSGEILAVLTGIDVSGTNTYSEMAPWISVMFPILRDAERIDHSFRKLAHEWSHDIVESGEHLLRKNARLHDALGNFGFATQTTPYFDTAYNYIDISRDQVKRLNTLWTWVQADTIRLFNIAVLLVVLLRLAAIPWIPFSVVEMPLLSFSGLAFIALLLVGESQPRYTLFLSLPFSFWVGQLAFKAGQTLPANWPRPVTLAAGGTVSAIFLTVFIAGMAAIRYSGVALEDLSSVRPISQRESSRFSPTRGKQLHCAIVTANFNRIDLRYSADRRVPADSVVGVKYSINRKARYIDLFVTTAPNAFRKGFEIDANLGPWAPYEIEYCVFLNEIHVVCDSVKDFESRFLSLSVPDDTSPANLYITLANSKEVPINSHPNGPVLSIQHLGVR